MIQAADQGNPQKSSSAMLTVLIDTSFNADADSLSERVGDERSSTTEQLRFSEGMMNVLVTVSLVAVSACLLATFLVVLFLIWKRHLRRNQNRRRKRKATLDSQSSHSSVRCGKRHVSIIDRRYFSEMGSNGRGNSKVSIAVVDELPNEFTSIFNDDECEAKQLERLEHLQQLQDIERLDTLDDRAVYSSSSVYSQPATHLEVGLCQDPGSADEIAADISCCDSNSQTHSVVLPLGQTRWLSGRGNLPERNSSTSLALAHNHKALSPDEQYCSLSQSLSVRSSCHRSATQGTLPRCHLRDSNSFGKMSELALKDSPSEEAEDDELSPHSEQHQESSFRPSGRRTASLYNSSPMHSRFSIHR